MTNNIETLNETAISTFATLREEVRPYALRFEKFATRTGLNRFMKMELSDNWDGDRYDVDITGPSAGGVTFTLRAEYYDDSYTYFFTIPYAYFEDPDAWEADANRHMADLTKDAFDAFINIFPDFKTDPELAELVFEVDAQFGYNAVPLAAPEYLEFTFKKEDYKRPVYSFVYDGLEYDARSFLYEISTGRVFYRGHFDMHSGAPMAVMTRPVTAEERAAEKAGVEARIEQQRQDLKRQREERMEAERQLIAESRVKKAQKRLEKEARHVENMRQKALAEARKAEQENKR